MGCSFELIVSIKSSSLSVVGCAAEKMKKFVYEGDTKLHLAYLALSIKNIRQIFYQLENGNFK